MNTIERANHHYYSSTAARGYTPSIDLNSQINNAVQNINMTLSDHANRLDSLFMELNDMRGFYMWIVNTYPEHLEQYRAIFDLKEASK